MNMKYKIKFHCKPPWQTSIECSQHILIPHDWHCSVDLGAFSFSFFVWQLAMCNWHLLFCPVPVSLLSPFGTDSSTKSAVPRNIFIFNCTLDANPFKLLRCTCGRAKVFAKFQLKSYEDVLWQVALKISLFWVSKDQMVFRFSLSAMSQLLLCRNVEANLLTQYLCRDNPSRWFCLW